MPMVEALLKNADLTAADVDVIAVAAGPGSFTGLRIGVAAAKGLAFALDKPCAGVSTLEALATGLAHTDAVIVCAMDARRGQIYNALFAAKDGVLTRLADDRAIALSDLAEELKHDSRPKIAVGDGGELCRDFLLDAGIACSLAPARLLYQHAIGVALCAEELAAKGALVTAQELTPVYLRPVHAVRLSDRMKKE